MSTPSTMPSTATTGPGVGTGAVSPAAASVNPLETSQGKTTIADAVVSKVASLAAREIPGVHGFGGGAARAFGAITERIPGARASSTQGVSVEVGERQAAVDLIIVVEYGVGIVELASAVRRNVIGAIESMTGLDVVEVNVNVNDLHLPGDDDGSDTSSEQAPSRPANRVQ